MRRAVAPLLLALAIVTPLAAQSTAPSGPRTGYSRLYVFGDSYSDIGAGYIDGNGPTAVAYLGWLMGLQVAPGKAANAACM
jgi:phospholipase/lecithinase/hemolysin